MSSTSSSSVPGAADEPSLGALGEGARSPGGGEESMASSGRGEEDEGLILSWQYLKKLFGVERGYNEWWRERKAKQAHF